MSDSAEKVSIPTASSSRPDLNILTVLVAVLSGAGLRQIAEYFHAVCHVSVRNFCVVGVTLASFVAWVSWWIMTSNPLQQSEDEPDLLVAPVDARQSSEPRLPKDDVDVVLPRCEADDDVGLHLAWDPLELRPDENQLRRAAEFQHGMGCILVHLRKLKCEHTDRKSACSTTSGELHTGSDTDRELAGEEAEPSDDEVIEEMREFHGVETSPRVHVVQDVVLQDVVVELGLEAEVILENASEADESVEESESDQASEGADVAAEAPEDATDEVEEADDAAEADQPPEDTFVSAQHDDAFEEREFLDAFEPEAPPDTQEDVPQPALVFAEESDKSDDGTLDEEAVPFIPRFCSKSVSESNGARMLWADFPVEDDFESIETPRFDLSRCVSEQSTTWSRNVSGVPTSANFSRSVSFEFGTEQQPTARRAAHRRHTNKMPVNPWKAPSEAPSQGTCIWTTPPPLDTAGYQMAVAQMMNMPCPADMGVCMWPVDAMAAGPANPMDLQRADGHSFGVMVPELNLPQAFGPMPSQPAPGVWSGRQQSLAEAFEAAPTPRSARSNGNGSGKRAAKPASSPNVPAASSRHLTLGEIMKTLQNVDSSQVVVVRKIKHLGFNSMKSLRAHFLKFGPVDRVLVSHSHVQDRVRPACLGFVVMGSAQGTLAALAAGSAQVVDKVTICVGPFQRNHSL